ncbi:hypothetical protein [Flavobacterium sp.]|uniref:hypothetical protein n=1 Tax=Flavobacterium sp. TaxID=239 RepID=UPI0012045711|nr:hypothetical protein [Flavobacterium sp.]RZJ73779.1 MAG: hypothetical protein EOO49_00020 [Flavobacterium sp.]
MKKVMLFFAAIAMATSCSTQDDVQTESTGKSLKVFKNIEDFNTTLDRLRSFDSQEDYQNWISQQSYKPLYNSEGFVDQDEIPFKLQFILNEDKQFMIGDKLITLQDGKLYQNSVSETGKASGAKKVFGEASVTKVSAAEPVDARVDIDGDGGSFKEGWEEFNRVSYAVGCNAPTNKGLRFRLVHYLVVENLTVDGAPLVQSDLLWKLRMSQYLNGSWVYNNTSTERRYSFSISGDYAIRVKSTGALVTNFATGTFNKSVANNCSTTVKGTQAWSLGYRGFPKPVNMSLYKWDVGISGHVYHKVNGDVEANSVDTNFSW